MPRRISLAVTVLIAAVVIGAASPAWGQHVAPDPNVVAVLQAIQTAYDHKDSASYDKLIAKTCTAVVSEDAGFPIPPMPRDELIKTFLEKGEGETLSPFVDATPISKRVLYAENIPGGQRLRVLLLNRPVPKATQTVSWVMDLSVTKVGTQLMMTEMGALPSDLAKQVFVPTMQELAELAKKNLTEAQMDAEVIAIYNKHWATFFATMPKPEAMPVGPTGTPKPLTPPVVTPPVVTPPVVKPPVVKRPAAVPPPPPPPIVVPTMPTAYVQLPAPVAKTLPPAQVTQRVQQVRTKIKDVVQKSFPAFKDRLIDERYWNFGGRRLYVNVFQNSFRASFGKITIIITINLVFVQPPNSQTPPTVYVAPTLQPDPNQPQPPPQQPVIPQTPIDLQPPPAGAAGCMVLTDTAKLKAKHGQRFDDINRYLAAFGPIIDLAGSNIRPGDAKAVDAIVKQKFDRNKCDCLFIFGNHDIVPFATYPNPTQGMAGDPDPNILSDDIYGDFDHDAENDPEIMVVRMPDDPGILADPNSVLYRPSATSQKITLKDYAIYGNIHRSSPPLLAPLASPGRPDLLERSTPWTADNFSKTYFKDHNALIDLHGGDQPEVAGCYWGEEQTPESKQVVAMTADHAVAPDGVVLCCACYGASIANIQSDGSIVPKSSDTHIAMRFLRNGASAFVGYTRVTWQAVGPDALTQAEGFSSKRFIELTNQGTSPQKAYQLVKREMARAVNRNDPQFQKMYHQMVYLGLPPTGNRAIAPVATPDRPSDLKTQLVRVLEQTTDAAKQKNVDKLTQLMTPTIRDGIKDGPDIDASKMAQQIVTLMSQPDAANPLADKSKIDEQMFLVEKADKNEYVASLRVPANQSVLNDPKGPKQPLDNVVRMKFRQDGDKIKISGWETKNQDFVQKVTQPQQQWIQAKNITDPAEAQDNYEDLVAKYVDDAVAQASKAKTDATSDANPLAPAVAVSAAASDSGSSGQMPTWVIVVLISAGGVVVVLIVVLAVVLRPRGPQGAMVAGGNIAVNCPQCGRQNFVPQGYAGQPIRCACGGVFQSPAAIGGVQVLGPPPVQPPAWPVAGMGQVVPQTTVIVNSGQMPPGVLPVRGERGGRCGRIIFISMMLAVAFFIPDIVPNASGGVTAQWSNLVALGDKAVPNLAKFLLAFPAGVALLALILALATDWRWRGVVLAALPWVPAVVLATQKDGTYWDAPQINVMGGIARSLFHDPNWLFIAGLLGVLVLWVGSRARWYRPSYHWLYLVTLAGCAGFAIFQAVPPGSGGAPGLPAAGFIATLREGAATTQQKVLAGFWLAGFGLVAIGGLLALCNVPGRRPSIRRVSGAAFKFVLLGLLVMVGRGLWPDFQGIGQLKGWSIFVTILGLVRFYLLFFGMCLLFLGGVVDAIIGPAPRRPGQW